MPLSRRSASISTSSGSCPMNKLKIDDKRLDKFLAKVEKEAEKKLDTYYEGLGMLVLYGMTPGAAVKILRHPYE